MRTNKKPLLLWSHEIWFLFDFIFYFIQDKIYNTLFLGYLEREFCDYCGALGGKGIYSRSRDVFYGTT